MIKIEKTQVLGWEAAIRGMRNPMNSWRYSDSKFTEHVQYFGDNDLELMSKLSKAGTDHRKFMRMVAVYVDITAPLYWWKEFDTYKVGTVGNSCSTMHKIDERDLTFDDFSHEHLYDSSKELLKDMINVLNMFRSSYNAYKDKEEWWQIIQLLPSSYNQKRTEMLNYEVLANMYKSRKNHKLDEWKDFCQWIETLPYSNIITGRDIIRDDCDKENVVEKPMNILDRAEYGKAIFEDVVLERDENGKPIRGKYISKCEDLLKDKEKIMRLDYKTMSNIEELLSAAIAQTKANLKQSMREELNITSPMELKEEYNQLVQDRTNALKEMDTAETHYILAASTLIAFAHKHYYIDVTKDEARALLDMCEANEFVLCYDENGHLYTRPINKTGDIQNCDLLEILEEVINIEEDNRTWNFSYEWYAEHCKQLYLLASFADKLSSNKDKWSKNV